MISFIKQLFFILPIITNTFFCFAQKITVDKDGSGNFKTIQEAINSLDTVTTKTAINGRMRYTSIM